jgi:hypothetical protein
MSMDERVFFDPNEDPVQCPWRGEIAPGQMRRCDLTINHGGDHTYRHDVVTVWTWPLDTPGRGWPWPRT